LIDVPVGASASASLASTHSLVEGFVTLFLLHLLLRLSPCEFIHEQVLERSLTLGLPRPFDDGHLTNPRLRLVLAAALILLRLPEDLSYEQNDNDQQQCLHADV
jgi:hypothetical protein